MADLKATWRSLSRNRLFSLMIVLSLGLAVGLSTTLFSLLKGVVLKPFPFEDASRLLAVWEKPLEMEEARSPLAPADFLDLQSRADAFSCLAAYRDDSGNLSGTSPPAEVHVRSYNTASLFDCLQVKPLWGRLPAPSETNLAVVGEGGAQHHQSNRSEGADLSNDPFRHSG